MLKYLSKIPEELHASSIRILYQNLKYLLLTPSILEKTESKNKSLSILYLKAKFLVAAARAAGPSKKFGRFGFKNFVETLVS